MVDNKLLPKLSQNLLEILDDNEYYDITIEVGNDPYRNDGNLAYIKLPNILPEIFNVVLNTNWEYVIKWGLAQNPELLTDTESYSKDDFNTLKNTLQQCIPLIRFHNLTSKEFSDKVMPYKKILPKDLYKELLKDFLNNNSSPIKNSLRSKNKDDKEIHMNINSKIISLPYIEIVTKWINRLKITDRLTNSYKYKLLFYGSCNDGDEIFGGYNPIKWKFDNSFGITKDIV
ncbi:hypothetical protein RirG_243040 [Rhizophagus irregularis DAOM 197198w]|uniref:TLDc domain-containing protein n=1 Tax=Rhizophagus irregularis (strain DAOM 197198w) TaxID=1432141 RepID=A0A015IHI7_RHIIW|nr:hypothetical protein RirG_243040 [Rhizophagus irregularis DAOM 197198w]